MTVATAALHWAMLHDQPDLIDVLSKWEEGLAALAAEDVHGATILHQAAAQGRTRIVSALLKAGMDVDITDHQDETPLFYAARNGHGRTIDILRRSGASLEATNANGKEPWAVAPKDLWTALTPPARANEWALTLIEAITEGRPQVVAAALERNDSQRLVQMVDHEGKTALHAAAAVGDSETITTLITKIGASIDTEDAVNRDTPLHTAAANGQVEAVRTLLDLGASQRAFNSDGHTPLITAVFDGRPEVVAAILERSCDAINQPDSTPKGFRPLHYAIEMDRPDLAQLLVRHGADITASAADDALTPQAMARTRLMRLTVAQAQEQGL
jgi:ankyrin repeat protein